MARKRDLDLRGDLQAEVMTVVWRLGEAKVEQVRSDLPKSRQAAYTTVQTVLNRLADRGLLERQRDGNAIVYRATFAEGDYLARSIGERLAGATPSARRAALAALVDNLDADDLDELARRANRVRRARRS